MTITWTKEMLDEVKKVSGYSFDRIDVGWEILQITMVDCNTAIITIQREQKEDCDKQKAYIADNEKELINEFLKARKVR